MKTLIILLANFTLLFCQSKNSEKSNYIIPKHLEEAFDKDFRVKENDEVINFNTLNIGKINLPTGKIIVSDGLVFYDNLPISTSFPKGKFPVELAIGKFQNKDKRVGFARIKFSENKPIKWTMANWGEDFSKLQKNEIFGFGVDSGTALLMDKYSSKDFNKFLTAEKNRDHIIKELEKNDILTIDWFLWKKKDKNAAIFSSGFGDGFYASYIGYDKENKICRLVIDFQILNY